jgi:GTPase-associated protein 1, C-terminal domain
VVSGATVSGATVSGATAQPVASPLPRRTWTPAERLAATELVERTLNTIPPDRMDLVLGISTRFEVEPAGANFRDAALRFVTWWADHPAEQLQPAGWPCRLLLIDLLRDELARRRPAATASAVREYWWRLLLPVTDPSSPLDASVAAAAVERGEPQVRRRVLATVLDFAAHSDRPDTGDLAWDALFRYVLPTTDQLLDLLCRLRPDTVSQAVANKALAALKQLSRMQLGGAELDVLERLAEFGWEPQDKRLADLRQQDTALRWWQASLPVRDADRACQDASVLRAVTEPVLRARRSEVLGAMLDLDVVPLAYAIDVVDGAGSHLLSFLLRELPALWNDESDGGRRGDAAVAVSFIATGSKAMSDQLATQFDARFKRWVRDTPPGRVNQVGRLLRFVDPAQLQAWRDAVVDALPRRRKAEIAPNPASPAKETASEQATTKQPKTSGRWLGRIRGGK